MKQSKSESGKFMPGLKAVLIGVAVSLAVSVAAVAIVAWMMGKGNVSESRIGIATTIITFLATFIGCFVCLSMINEKALLHSGTCAAGYIFILAVINIFGFDGQFQGVFGRIMTIAIAAILCALLKSKTALNGSKRRFKVG